MGGDRFGPGRIEAWTAAADARYTFGVVLLHHQVSEVHVATIDRGNHDREMLAARLPHGSCPGGAARVGPGDHVDLADAWMSYRS